MPYGDRDPAHFLAPTTSTTVPRRLLWLDCAGTASDERGTLVRRWQAGALGSTHWTSRKGVRKDTLNAYHTPEDLWRAADGFCVSNRRTVLFGYDLAVQLRLSRALIVLPRMGWELKRIVMERGSAWASFKHGKRSLLMCDLHAWAPVSLHSFARDVSHVIVDFAERGQAGELVATECMQRCRIIRESVLSILDWVEHEGLGQFRPTGSGQSYSAFRRRFHRYRLLVHDDPVRLAAEREAMWTGRCEAWRHGILVGSSWREADMSAAYCRIAASEGVPAVALAPIRKPTVQRLKSLMAEHAVLADITVNLQVPCLPARLGGRTAWPTGEWRGWYWDPEIRLALEYADIVKVHHAYPYTREPALRDFATWVLTGMHAADSEVPPAARRVLKHWSRCLVGRLGLRYRAWTPFARADENDLQLVSHYDCEDGTVTDMLIAGRDWMLLTGMQEALESLPQIPAWVMSECRRLLWKAMMFVGLPYVAYVDTDSIIYDVRADEHGGCAAEWLYAQGWTEKGHYSTMTIHGPRNYSTSSSRKVAGLPLTARQVAPLEFTGEVMRSVKESMRAGQLDNVVMLPRTFRLTAPDMRRLHLPYGHTEPFTVQLPPTEVS